MSETQGLPNISALKEFNVHVDRWSTYVSRLRTWMSIHDIKPANYSKYLVAVVGTEALDLIIDLCYPDKPESVQFEQIVKIVEEHLSPKRSVIAERMIFRSYKQSASQSVGEYQIELKRLSRACKFSSNEILKENLRDQFVFGLACERIQQRLLMEDEMTLTFSRACELALSLEAAVRDSKPGDGAGMLRSAAEPVHAVDRTRGGRAPRRGRPAPPGRAQHGGRAAQHQQQQRCYRCGRTHHPDECSFRDSDCYVCGDRGHIAKMCRYRKNKARVHHISDNNAEDSASESSGSDDRAIDIYQLSDSETESDDRWVINAKINNIPITMEGDTGSAISVISIATYNKYFRNCELKPLSTKLKMYSGQLVKPSGKLLCSVEINGKIIRDLSLTVIGNDHSSSLFGRDWMRAFNFRFPRINELKEIPMNVQSTANIKRELMKRFPNVFAAGIGTFNKARISLETVTSARPVWRRARPVPHALRPRVDTELARLQREGIITPVDWSEWGTPVVPVLKKNGEVRLCGDFKTTVNPVLVEDKYPIPRIEDIFASLQGGKLFSKIDLSSAYLQFLLDEPSRKLCTIVTTQGMFCYNRLPFGIKCAPNKFQRMMDKLFRMPFVTCYLDDLTVSGVDSEDHWKRLQAVFKILSDSGLRVAPEKCSFFQKTISYLGYVIDADGLHTEISKVDAVINTPTPTTQKQLRAFLGLINYYGNFLFNLSDTLAPLYDLLKREKDFQWNEHCDKAFSNVKKALQSAPVLAHYNPTLATTVSSDASPRALGAVLSQRGADGCERPVVHASRTLAAAERNYAQICREGLAVIFAVTKFHDYLYGREFTLVTDCKPLAAIFNENKGIPLMAASRLQRWAVILGAYNYKIRCIASNHNCVADSLSRMPTVEQSDHSRVEYYINFVQNASPINYREIAKVTTTDNELQEIHNTHQGIVKCKNLARNYVYWPGIDTDIERVCRACETCARERPAPPAAVSRTAALHPWQWPQEPWYRLHADFFSLAGNTLYYFVIIDAHSKWIEAYRVPSTAAKTTIQKLKIVFGQFGLPYELVSDNGPPFNGNEFQCFLNNSGIRHITVTPYKPSSNGAAENAVKIVKTCLKKAIRDHVELETALSDFLLMYRSTPHSITGKSPASLLLGRNVRTPLDLLRPSASHMIMRKQLAQIEYKAGYNRYFNIGERVFFKNFKNNTATWERGTITDRIGPLTYIVAYDGKHLKKHVDQLRRDDCDLEDLSSINTPLQLVSTDVQIPQADNRQMPSNSESTCVPSADTSPSPLSEPRSPVLMASSSLGRNPNHPVNAESNMPHITKRIRKPVQRYGFDID
ncbi:uncharacterized protein K02A2.6-like [Pectinophora gossypiella]|uniref:uncharacterized protein K02A2.6-like n=1 Tax=Pectinophora gossypiella TaxID=13191 RepID=UPI00214E5503|nr:uncharacterized protein K02A2.6-like [Pectinophora gossypiella]